MWASITFAVISLGGVAFMLRFLLALRRESTRFTCSSTIWFHPELNPESSGYLGQHYLGDYSGNCEDRDYYYVELPESDIHAQQSSSLITLTIRPRIGSVGGRPKFPGRVDIHHQRRFFG
jgi:hypothetical protein